ncbi:hypothetical protein O3M35_004112 [Rhynocoris fuscipes]|uniref:PHD-type domain-containing protein n=1 Tax=Rhynocoris fuscipes TaxID=488301 RepID=A0AAW1CIF2_9HEMI
MSTIDNYTRHSLKVSVAQICQVIGWTAINSTPLEILTDLLQEYMMSLARITNNYATHYGMNSAGVQHVALSLKTFGVTFNELLEYMSYVEAPPVLDVPSYPVKRENHLNFLKPGSREVVTRPVHIHEYLPPINPHSQDEDSKDNLSVDVNSNGDVSSPVHSPKGVFKKPGDPDLLRRPRPPVEEEVRALREITSVMMTTSGFLSPAREGKLPEARTPLSSQGTMTTNPPVVTVEKQESETNTLPPPPPPPTVVPPPKEKKKKKLKELKSKESVVDSDNKTNKVPKEFKPKIPKLNKPVERPPSPVQKSSFSSVSGNLPTPNTVNKTVQRKQSTSPMPFLNVPTMKSTRPAVVDKPPKIHTDEVKLPSDVDKQKLNIFKKISKAKDEVDISDIEPKDENEKWTGLDEVIDAVSRGMLMAKEEVHSSWTVPPYGPVTTGPVKQEPDIPLDLDTVTSPHNNKENFEATVSGDQVLEVRPPEVKKRKKEKHHRERNESKHNAQHDHPIHSINSVHDVDHKSVKPLLAAVEEQMTKSALPSPLHPGDLSILPNTSHLASPFPYYPFPSGVLSHPLIPQRPLNPFVTAPPLPPLPVMSSPISSERENNSSQGRSMQNQSSTVVAQTIQNSNVSHQPSTSISSVPKPAAIPAPVLPSPAPPSTPTVMGPPSTSLPLPSSSTSASTISSPKIPKKEHKKIKKLKDKLKKKKGKKEKSKSKIKSEKKRLKHEKKERKKEKLKTKTEKKERKKEKQQNSELKVENPPNVPKITLKLSPVSSQDSPTDLCHRKIVIKPVVKKEEEKAHPVPWASGTSNNTTVLPVVNTSKPHKSQKSSKNTVIPVNTLHEEEPKIVPPSVAHAIQNTISSTPPTTALRVETQMEYICPACHRPDDGSAMIACDSCDQWFHWICVGIQEPPESDWYCRKCTLKMDGGSEKRKKHKKKKNAI